MLIIDRTTYRSPNFNERPGGISPHTILYHSGEGTKKSDLQTLTNPNTANPVSSNLYIDRQGGSFLLVDLMKRAWHAGESSYLGLTDWNNHSIGIELEHITGQNWTAAQFTTLTTIVSALIVVFGIKREHHALHRWVAPKRKQDPTNWSDEEFNAWVARLYACN